jgi:hypothetical protein
LTGFNPQFSTLRIVIQNPFFITGYDFLQKILPFEPSQQGHSRITPSLFVFWAELCQDI